MLDHRHYVPVLRWKQGEKFALRDLFSTDRSKICPLIELIPPNFKDEKVKKTGGVSNVIMVFAKELLQCWGEAAFFLDTSHINAINQKTTYSVLTKELQIQNLIPVLKLNNSQEIINILKGDVGHIGLRIKWNDFRDSQLSNKIQQILHTFNINPQNVDIIADLEQIDNYSSEFSRIYQNVLCKARWHSIIMMSGSFPKNLTDFHIGQHKLERKE